MTYCSIWNIQIAPYTHLHLSPTGTAYWVPRIALYLRLTTTSCYKIGPVDRVPLLLPIDHYLLSPGSVGSRGSRQGS